MTWDVVGGFVRHVLTFGGGYLVTNGTLSDADMQAGVGALVTLIGLGWSWFAKRKASTPVE